MPPKFGLDESERANEARPETEHAPQIRDRDREDQIVDEDDERPPEDFR